MRCCSLEWEPSDPTAVYDGSDGRLLPNLPSSCHAVSAAGGEERAVAIERERVDRGLVAEVGGDQRAIYGEATAGEAAGQETEIGRASVTTVSFRGPHGAGNSLGAVASRGSSERPGGAGGGLKSEMQSRASAN
jgi:hypothetical protein